MAAKENLATTAATAPPVPWAPASAIAAPTPQSASAAPIPNEVQSPDLTVASEPAIEIADELVDTVTVTVPKAFKLRLDQFRELQFKAGVQEMERDHALHWYSVANGVRIYKP